MNIANFQKAVSRADKDESLYIELFFKGKKIGCLHKYKNGGFPDFKEEKLKVDEYQKETENSITYYRIWVGNVCFCIDEYKEHSI